MPVPNTFANATATIPLSQLDANFATTITLGNTAIQLGNTVSTLNNMTLANVTISSGNVTITNVTVTTANVTTANIGTSIITTSETLNYGTANSVQYLNTSKVLTSDANFVYTATGLGVGTSSPAVKLDVAGNAIIQNGVLTVGKDTLYDAFINTPESMYFNVDSDGNSTGNLFVWGTDRTGNSGGTEWMRLNSAGNLGLGVVPSAWNIGKTFELPNGVSLSANSGLPASYLATNARWNSGWIYITSAAATYYNQQQGAHAWFTAASGTAGNAITFTQAMTLDASGNLLVGATSALTGGDSLLYVAGSIYSAVGAAGLAGNGAQGYTLYNQYYNGTNNAARITGFGGRWTFDIAAGYLSYITYPSTTAGGVPTGTERARITSDGYFKATSTGTYSAGATGAVHEFDTSSVNGTIVNFYNQAASNPNGIYVNYTAADPNDATRYVFGAQQNTGVWIYRIYSNGTVAARSDAKWKKNIETTRDGYAEDLAKLRVVKYNWYNHEDGTPKELGLIAQEVEQVFPGLVTTDEQTRNEVKTREVPAVLDEEGNEVEPARTEEYTEKVGTGEYSKSIKFSVLPIMLLKAIQEQQAMIDELKAKVAALENA